MVRLPIVPGYKILEIVVENHIWVMYKGYFIEDKKLVLIKRMKVPSPTHKEIASTIHEFHLSNSLQMDEILRPIDMVNSLNETLLVYEYFNGITLKEFISNKKLDIIEFLQIAIPLATALMNLHQQQVIHKNINPENIIMNHNLNQLKLTGFNFSTKLKRENQRVGETPYELEGELAYISPEQTGRMNRSVDFRTDLYSLGVTLFEMITNKLPFTNTEPIEIVHSHLVKTPPHPKLLNHEIPDMISRIIMKLLSKMPDNRYNSVYGLREDLMKCLDQLRVFGKIEEFTLGKEDSRAYFEAGRKLYGRQEELENLRIAFERVSEGNSELVLIQGHSGIGKTALVNEIQTPLVRTKGYYISGKFDLLQRQKPYSPIIHAFKSLLRQILAEGEERVLQWRGTLEKELSSNISVISSIIPEVKWLLGNESVDEVVSSIQSQSLFQLMFQKFVNVFATKEHPVVLFLDDLQWADAASLELIQFILTHVDCRYFLVLGAYRDNEVGIEHPFMETVRNLQDAKVPITKISLSPLNEPMILKWVEETLLDRGKGTEKLANFLFRITQGNPFYIKQLFQSFFEDGTIFFHEEDRKWKINFYKANNALLQENIVEFMVKKIQQLPIETQKVLKMAACIGSEFELKTLSIICEQEFEKTASYLWDALQMGLILPQDSGYKWIYPKENEQFIVNQPPTYRFLHDRVQQAVYTTMSTEEQEKAHLKIGRLLVKYGAVDSQLFEIVNHLNSCRRFLHEEEIILLVEWNVRAGEQAKESAAYKESLSYFRTAHEMIEEAWETNYVLTKRLMTGLGECLYLNSHFEEAEAIFNKILGHARTNHEKLEVYNKKVVLYTHVHRVEEAVESGISGLRLFGWKINRNPSRAAIAKELLQVKMALRGKKANDLLELPKLLDKEKQLHLETMITMNAPSFHVDQNLATILMLRALRYTIKHGITDITSLVFNNYALILSAGFSDFNGSFEFGSLAVELAERSGNKGLKGRTYFVFGSFVNHWRRPIRYNLDYLKRSQQNCIEAGNIHLAGANSSFIAITLLINGDPLKDTLEGIKNQLLFIDQIRYRISKGFLMELTYWISVLMDQTEEVEWEFKKVLDDDSAKIIHYTVRLQMSYLFDKTSFAKQLLTELEKLVNKRLTLIIVAEYYFYYSLWLSRFYQDSPPTERKLLYKKLKKNEQKLGMWAEFCPENYVHKYMLIKAEIARIDENHIDASTYYDHAIRSAGENNFIHDVGICNETTGEYYLSRGLETLGSAYMAEAYRNYMRWGAKAKAEQLLKKYPAYIHSAMVENQSLSVYQLDIQASLKATQAISSEIIQEKLVKNLMNITMENAGAERGFLLVNRDGNLVVVANESFGNSVEANVTQQRIVEFGGISEMIVKYVEKTREVVLLNNAAEGMFAEDPYIVTYKPKSILCIPAIHKGKVNSILYLENNQITHAFTQDRVKFLSFISTQVAISIENAELYGKLEEKVRERTKELEIVNQHLEKANRDLARSEHSRRQFLSNISHDLRSPIASVQGNIEAILEGVVETEEQKEAYLRKSIDRIKELGRLIGDIFELSQIESGHISFDFDIVPIDRLIRHVSEQFEYDVRRADLTYNLKIEEIEDEFYPMVEVDVKRFSQVFSNIVSNAIKYTKTGGIFVSLQLDKQNGHCLISIEDSGAGIAKDELPYIFDRHFTKARNALQKGNGLGLAISREIVLFHKGRMWAESRLGKGTTIHIQIPVIQEDIDLV
ncbi:AAA family ATPase [Ferdinandcohnia sp. Marseille-Q9671]